MLFLPRIANKFFFCHNWFAFQQSEEMVMKKRKVPQEFDEENDDVLKVCWLIFM